MHLPSEEDLNCRCLKLLCHVGARYARNVRPYLESNNLVSHEVKDGEIRCWVTRLMSA